MSTDSVSPSFEPMQQNSDESKRVTMPLGIKLVAAYAVLGVLATLPTGIALLYGELTTETIFVGSVSLLFGMLFLAIVYGLLKLKLWGYKLAKTIYSIVIAFGAIALVSNLTIGNVIQQGIGLGLAIWIVVYLRKENIKAYFGISVLHGDQQ